VSKNLSFSSSTDLLSLSNERKKVSALEGEAFVVNCPVSSVPKANVTWFKDKEEIDFEQRSSRYDPDKLHEKIKLKKSLVRRFFLLTNGSLLIVESQTDDSVIYRCNASNQFTKKIFRTLSTEVTVQARPDNHRNDAGGLLPSLQSSTQKIKSGLSLVLHCASHANKVSRKIRSRSEAYARLELCHEALAFFPRNHRLNVFDSSISSLFFAILLRLGQ
jgi:Immunoglobulin domain